ncbi:PDR/VanB family oxidoreductase [Methylobacterium brachythecii]|uniref:Ferredoxin--NADP(+) reductase n=1 Tax=Methylobacterium brachythecii TaxID=1176177 RepID=A0A7W6F7N3_9HYPH|nr:PDR/VanB family oxidoreductase [Methylobacterium brachythecii]MBB3903276.1 ferredoxin-NADP reductase [Methylobacterium brachythecii]GLS46106.1 ferredoxin--NADP(+) reductase [Methylobacterium brachythecii]
MIVEGKLSARVVGVDTISPTLKRFRFAPQGGGQFPTAAPGAHILVTLRGPDRVWKNSYSLVTTPEQRDQYAIIVRRADASRGGSHFLHDVITGGEAVELSAPASLFPIASLARKHILISGGIGLTPFLSYVPVLRSRKATFELHQFCSEGEAGVFRDLLGNEDGRIHVHGSTSRPALDQILADQPLGTHVYTCGPDRLMEGVAQTARRLGFPENAIHQESFGAATGGQPFVVRLTRSRKTIEVGETQTLLEALEAAGVEAPCLCRGGACGVCLVPVVDGEPEHRDHVLSDAERAEGRIIATCVSRAKSASLVLDL